MIRATNTKEGRRRGGGPLSRKGIIEVDDDDDDDGDGVYVMPFFLILCVWYPYQCEKR